MAALNFPSSPTLNEIYTANGRSWIWNGNSWNVYFATNNYVLKSETGSFANTTNEVYIDAAAMTTGGSSGALADRVYLGGADIVFDSYVFDAGVDSYSQFKFSLPENLETGSLRAKFKWTAENGGTGHVLWGIQARSAANDDTISGSWGSAVEVVDEFITGYDCHITSGTSQISTANALHGGDVIFFRAYRKSSDSSDTLAVNAILQGVSVQYSTTGSSASW